MYWRIKTCERTTLIRAGGGRHFPFILQILVVIFLTLVYFSIIYQIWNYDFRVPYPYTVGETDGDGLFVLSTIKGVFQTGWYIFNPYLGAPFGREMYDFPIFTDITNILMIRFFLMIMYP